MARIEGETVIRRPPEVVFDFVADETNEPRYNPRMVRSRLLSSGPIGRGTKFLASFRSGVRMEPALIEYVEYRKPERIVSVTRMRWADVRGEVGFSPAAYGTPLRWSWDLRPAGLVRFFTPALTLAGRRQERATWANLKRLLEADSGHEDDGRYGKDCCPVLRRGRVGPVLRRPGLSREGAQPRRRLILLRAHGAGLKQLAGGEGEPTGWLEKWVVPPKA